MPIFIVAQAKVAIYAAFFLSYSERMKYSARTGIGTAAVDRALDLLDLLVTDAGRLPLSVHAHKLSLPPSTAHRLAALLVRRGLIASSRRGHYIAGLGLADLASHARQHSILTGVARPLLRQLARETGATAHLGVWDSDMVTYLVKECRKGTSVFTREGEQLEGYCSAIGKVLLAHLAPEALETYLVSGPFVALTPHTLTDPSRIRAAIVQSATLGYAFDHQEVAMGLFCVAMPVQRGHGEVIAAISLSGFEDVDSAAAPPVALRRCAEAISDKLGWTPV
jgi:IclR family transcriptional regulator, acetate operon repressor